MRDGMVEMVGLVAVRVFLLYTVHFSALARIGKRN